VLILTYALSLAAPAQAQGAGPEVMGPVKLNLMPVPASVQTQTGRLPITGSFNVAVRNYADDRLRAGIGRMLKRLAGRTVIESAADLATDEKYGYAGGPMRAGRRHDTFSQ